MKPNFLESNLAKPILTLLCVICFSLWVRPESVDAHRVNVFAWIEGDTVYVEGKFSGGKRVHTGEITVLDSQGARLLSGTIDENGQFSFKPPQKTDLTIVLEAGTGHRAQWTITANEINKPTVGQKPIPKEIATTKGIIIGLGSIFGLTAVIAYIRNRRKKNMEHEDTKN